MKSLIVLAIIAAPMIAPDTSAQTMQYDPGSQYLARIDGQLADCGASVAWQALNRSRIQAMIQHLPSNDPVDFDHDLMIGVMIKQCKPMVDAYRQPVAMMGSPGLSAEAAAARAHTVAEVAIEAVLDGYNPILPGGGRR